MDYLQISYYLNRPNATWDSRYLSFHHLSLTSLCPDFFRGTIIIEAQTKQVLWEVAADMIVIKILAAPFVVALTDVYKRQGYDRYDPARFLDYKLEVLQMLLYCCLLYTSSCV